MGLITAGIVGIFLPFGKTTDLVIACIGVLVFSGFVLYDTQNIMKRLSVDEAILGKSPQRFKSLLVKVRCRCISTSSTCSSTFCAS